MADPASRSVMMSSIIPELDDISELMAETTEENNVPQDALA
jgi:hypothetical protein